MILMRETAAVSRYTISLCVQLVIGNLNGMKFDITMAVPFVLTV